MALTKLPARCLAHSGRAINASCQQAQVVSKVPVLSGTFLFCRQRNQEGGWQPYVTRKEEERKRWRLEKKQGRVPGSAPVGNPVAETVSITSSFLTRKPRPPSTALVADFSGEEAAAGPQFPLSSVVTAP